MRNDPYTLPSNGVLRPEGHRPARSLGKLDVLFQPLQATGVPLGGVGTGGITYASDGRFSRWTLKAGSVSKFSIPANGFLLRVKPKDQPARARALQPDPAGGDSDDGGDPALSSFDFAPQTPEWGGLFPFAWHRHPAFHGVRAECLSFSPIIQGDFATSCLPVAVFEWRLTNDSDREVEASLALSFANLNGWFDRFDETRPERVAAGCFNTPMQAAQGTGVVFDRRYVGDTPPEGSGQWGIGLSGDGAFNRTVCFDGAGDGAEFWEPFLQTGEAPDLGPGWVSESGFRETPPGHPAGAVCSKLRLAPGESAQLRATLVWDMPMLRFGQGRDWARAYTDQWGRQGRNATGLTDLAQRAAPDWQRRVEAWHSATRDALGPAPHQSGMAINESYFLVEGLTVATSAHGAPDGRAHFGLIECHDYALYNTMDLWIYAAEAVGRFFPEQAASVARDYAEFTLQDDRALRRHRWDNSLFPINPAGACPHDLGGPGEDPFVTPNSYTYRDGTIWKDLNCDLVLCLFREGQAMGADWRTARFPAVEAAINHLQKFDRDGDGLIENDGSPDQTFDNIPMTGPSSYCGGLWIATLLAGAKMAAEAGAHPQARAWADQARAAAQVFDKRLFNGRWYRVDTDGPFSEACFIEQLFGVFLAKRLGLGDVIPDAHARSALSEIFQSNFLDAGGGEGAVSLTGLSKAARAHLPHQDDPSFQTAEIQPGFNFSLAAQLSTWGLSAEAEQLRRALYHQLYERRNLAFQTPAAFDRSGPGALTCRAILNMRPLAAWWIGAPPTRPT